MYLIEGRRLGVPAGDDRVGGEIEQFVDAVVPRRVTVREIGQFRDHRANETRTDGRARVPHAGHCVAHGQPLVLVARVEPVDQAVDETPAAHVRRGLFRIEQHAVHESLERLVHNDRLGELGRRDGQPVVRRAVDGYVAADRGRQLVVRSGAVRRRRQRPEHVRREHFHHGLVHIRRIICREKQ